MRPYAIGAFTVLIIGMLIAGIMGAIQYDNTSKEGSDSAEIALVQGVQHYFATVQSPASASISQHPVKVTLSLDNGPNVVVVTAPEAGNSSKYDINWDTKKVPNGEHVVKVKAFWGEQMIGEESRRVDISN